MSSRQPRAAPAASDTPAAERHRPQARLSIARAPSRNLVLSAHSERQTNRDRRGLDRGDAYRRPLPRAHPQPRSLLQRVRADSLPRPRRDRMVPVARRASRNQRAETDSQSRPRRSSAPSSRLSRSTTRAASSSSRRPPITTSRRSSISSKSGSPRSTRSCRSRWCISPAPPRTSTTSPTRSS